MQSVIRSSEQRVSKEKKHSEAARVRALRQHVGLMLCGTMLLVGFAMTNIVLLTSVLRPPVGDVEDARPGVGPLLRERMRRQGKRGPGRLRAALNGTLASARQGLGRVKSFLGGARVDPAHLEHLADAESENVRHMAMHEALRGRDGRASKALGEALGFLPAKGQEPVAGQPAAASAAQGQPPAEPATDREPHAEASGDESLAGEGAADMAPSATRGDVPSGAAEGEATVSVAQVASPTP